MRVLLDENLPHDLIAALVGHEVVSVHGLGWAGVQNGELLRRASGHIDVFITMDRKLERQQDLAARPSLGGQNRPPGVGMAWVQVIAGSLLIIATGLQFRKLRSASVAWPPHRWTGVALGSSILLSGAAQLIRPSALRYMADGGSILCMGAALLLIYQQYQRNLVRHLNDLEARRKP